MSVTLAQVKDYLRIDADHENALLQSFMEAAESYLVASVDGYADRLAQADFSAKANMVMLAIISEMYRNSDPSNDQRTNFPFYIMSQIAQLQYWPDAETASEGAEDTSIEGSTGENLSTNTGDSTVHTGDNSTEATP